MLNRLLIGTTALALLAYAGGLVWGGPTFPDPGLQAEAVPIWLFVSGTLFVTALYVLTCIVSLRRPPRLTTVILIGAAARLILLFGAPGAILEGDHQRLRVDARLVNQGIHPYEFTPSHLLDQEADDALLTGSQLRRLTYARASIAAQEDAPRPDRVRRPDQRSTAAPLSLWIGSVADWFKPDSTRGFAFFVLVADAVAVFLLILALRALQRPVAWALVYAWSPVLLKESYCTISPDAFLMPALAGLVYCIASRRKLLLAVPLALCAGIRPILILLWPVMARRTGLLGISLTVMLFVMPYLAFYAPEVPLSRFSEGQLHVWRHFEYNSLLENVGRRVAENIGGVSESTLTLAGVDFVSPGDAWGLLLVKLLGAAIALGVVTYLAIRVADEDELPEDRAKDALRDLLVIVGTLLLVTPVLHPWHAVWLLPILALRPSGIAWLAFPGLVVLSYLTQLEGPDAADLTFAGGHLSFRLIEYGVFLLLVLVDYGTHNRFFTPPKEPTRVDRVRKEPEDDFAYADPLEIGVY